MTKPGDCPLVPVHGAAGCAGHLLRTAKGFRGFDRDGKQIGTFENINHDTAALLELATVEMHD